MIYDKPILSSFSNPSVFSAVGCKHLFLTNSKNVQGYNYEGRLVKELAIPSCATFSVLDNISNLNYTVKTENSRNGNVYNVEISFVAGGLRADVTHVVEQIIANELTAIIEDKNNRYWLAGFSQGLISNYEAKTEDSSYLVTMTTRQLTKVEEILSTSMKDIELADYDTSISPAPVYTVPNQGGSDGGSTSGNKNYTVTVITQQNYVIKPSDEFLLLPTANTLYLPDTAEQGKQYIIKADYDASVTPSYIKGTIDTETEFIINTPSGSISVIYSEGNWYTVAYSL